MSIDTSVGRVEGVECVRVSIDTSVQVSGQGSGLPEQEEVLQHPFSGQPLVFGGSGSHVTRIGSSGTGEHRSNTVLTPSWRQVFERSNTYPRPRCGVQ